MFYNINKIDPDTSVGKVGRGFPMWLMVFILVFCTAVIVFIGTYLLFKETKIGESILNSNFLSEKVLIKDNFYQYGNNKLSYEKNPQLEYPDQEVTVYHTGPYGKVPLIWEVPVDVPGAGMPVFKLTSRPEIALLTVNSGDMGAYFTEDYYIDILKRDYINMRDSGGSELEIKDPQNRIYKIGLAITDGCSGNNGEINAGAQVMFKGITLGGTEQNFGDKPKVLTCVDPGGIGNIYSPYVGMGLFGISKDLSKVYFYVKGGKDNDKGEGEFLWQDNYSFDISTKIIKKENPSDLIYSDK